MELLIAIFVALGFWAFAEFLLMTQRPAYGRWWFIGLLVVLFLLFFALVLNPGVDPTPYAIAIAVVGALALTVATK